MPYQTIQNAVNATLKALDEEFMPPSNATYTPKELDSIISNHLKAGFRLVPKSNRKDLYKALCLEFHPDKMASKTNPFFQYLKANSKEGVVIPQLTALKEYLADVNQIGTWEGASLLWNNPPAWVKERAGILSKIQRDILPSLLAYIANQKLAESDPSLLDEALEKTMMDSINVLYNEISDDIYSDTLFSDYKRYAKPIQFFIDYFVLLPTNIVLYAIGFVTILPALIYVGVLNILSLVDSFLINCVISEEYALAMDDELKSLKLDSEAVVNTLFTQFMESFGESFPMIPAHTTLDQLPDEYKAIFKNYGEGRASTLLQIQSLVHSQWVFKAIYHRLSAPLPTNGLAAFGEVMLRIALTPVLAMMALFSAAIDILKLAGITAGLGLLGALTLVRTIVTVTTNLPLYVYEGFDALVQTSQKKQSSPTMGQGVFDTKIPVPENAANDVLVHTTPTMSDID